MSDFLSLDLAKSHLRVVHTRDDAYIELLIKAALKAVLNFIDFENWDENKRVHKTVYWYLMHSRSMDTVPQREEGFIEAKFIHIDRVLEMAKYDDEKEIINVALDEINKKSYNNSGD